MDDGVGSRPRRGKLTTLADDRAPEAAERPVVDAPARRLRWLLGAFYALSAVFVLVAVASTVDRASGRIIPSAAAIGFSLVVLMLALRCSASAWALLPGEATPAEHRACVYSSQLGKYIPGGIVQGVAFGLGLLAIPVPSGLLVRGALLLAILHPVAGAATVVTVAVVQRLVAIAAEILMLVANRLAPKPFSRMAAPADLQGAP